MVPLQHNERRTDFICAKLSFCVSECCQTPVHCGMPLLRDYSRQWEYTIVHERRAPSATSRERFLIKSKLKLLSSLVECYGFLWSRKSRVRVDVTLFLPGRTSGCPHNERRTVLHRGAFAGGNGTESVTDDWPSPSRRVARCGDSRLVSQLGVF